MAFGSSDYAAQDYANAKKLDEMVDVLKAAMSEIRGRTKTIKTHSTKDGVAYVNAENIELIIESALLRVQRLGGL